ncbi:DUF2911 domain-containing protein [Arenibacter sp. GZD96]|uniref:DUF2911 domain-containing protein n=1 Tax=Aurantibrevibacter litoralis TaxID=3106030 RepID=UPI002AFEDA1D|nr:DUF2911 domain-containing protein [Arenibacter sp. GZD-96]MEA1785127.1 DUF2911 domain-containing protein [Arenibacter sp. GZD-96]
MKKLVALCTLVVALVCTTAVSAQFSGLDNSPADIAAYPASGQVPNKLVKVIYSRPQLKGRSLSELAPNGQVWRTGANEASEITFYKDVTFGGKSIKAGSYSLFTIPSEKEWTVILNKKLNQWGAYSYDPSADVVRVTASVSKNETPIEAFSIGYQEVDSAIHLLMGWSDVKVAVPIVAAL